MACISLAFAGHHLLLLSLLTSSSLPLTFIQFLLYWLSEGCCSTLPGTQKEPLLPSHSGTLCTGSIFPLAAWFTLPGPQQGWSLPVLLTVHVLG